MKSIKKQYESLDAKRDAITAKINELQESCMHANVEKEHRGSTGNWSKSDDGYWIEFNCPDCRKRWTEDQ